MNPDVHIQKVIKIEKVESIKEDTLNQKHVKPKAITEKKGPIEKPIKIKNFDLIQQKQASPKKKEPPKKLKIILIKPPPEKTIKFVARTKSTAGILTGDKSLLHEHKALIQEMIHCSNATLIRNIYDNGYHCFYCKKHEASPFELKRHTMEAHSDANTLTCFTKRDCVAKLRVKLDITDLKCKLCSIEINTLEELKEHLANIHKRPVNLQLKNQIVPMKFDDGDLKCCICGNFVYFMSGLLKHMHSHYPHYECTAPGCNAAFMNQGCLQTHVRHSHTACNLKCKFCSEVFDREVMRKTHEKYKHGAKVMMSKCHICGMKFSDFAIKQRHVSQVHDGRREYKCNACDSVLCSVAGLRRHVNRVHLMERRFPCGLCDKAFFAKAQLDNHMISHTGERNFKCDFCNKKFSRKKTLKEHIRIHLNDRRFKCQLCGLGFVQNCSLKGHMKSKHGQ